MAPRVSRGRWGTTLIILVCTSLFLILQNQRRTSQLSSPSYVSVPMRARPAGCRATRSRLGRITTPFAQKNELHQYEYFEMGLLSGKTNLQDFMEQLDIFESTGGLLAVVERLPAMEEQINDENVMDTEHRVARYRSIIERATSEERENLDLLTTDISAWERKIRIASEAGYSAQDIDEFIVDFRASVNSFSEKPEDLGEPTDKVIPLVLAATSFWHPDKITDVPVKNEHEMKKLEKKMAKAKKKTTKKKNGFG
eukprot:jgi/Bigna1/90234/estExt_fgenesh1_pg.C_650105